MATGSGDADVAAESIKMLPPDRTRNPAIEDIFRRHHDWLMRFLSRRLVNGDDAADLAQETYCRLTRYDSLADIEHPRALLFRIADNLVKDKVRRAFSRHSSDHVPLDESVLQADEPGPERTVGARQELTRLRAAILCLPPRCKKVFLLSRYENMTYPEIAAHCGITVSMVEKHISRALSELRARMGESAL